MKVLLLIIAVLLLTGCATTKDKSCLTYDTCFEAGAVILEYRGGFRDGQDIDYFESLVDDLDHNPMSEVRF